MTSITMALTQAKVPLPPPPKTLMLSFFYLAFLAPSKKGGQSFGGMLGQSSNFFCFNLNIKSYENSQKPSPRPELWVPLQLSISLPVFQLDFESYLVQKRARTASFGIIGHQTRNWERNNWDPN
jgi:hypothetical protein